MRRRTTAYPYELVELPPFELWIVLAIVEDMIAGEEMH
jgi:hypothetical protein